MAEWSNAAVSKTVVLHPRDRGFEPPSLRKAKINPAIRRGCLFYRRPFESSLSKGAEGKINKTRQGLFWLCRVPPKGSRAKRATPLTTPVSRDLLSLSVNLVFPSFVSLYKERVFTLLNLRYCLKCNNMNRKCNK